jgi:hypothetical protein
MLRVFRPETEEEPERFFDLEEEKKSKVGYASLLLVGVFKNPSDPSGSSIFEQVIGPGGGGEVEGRLCLPSPRRGFLKTPPIHQVLRFLTGSSEPGREEAPAGSSIFRQASQIQTVKEKKREGTKEPMDKTTTAVLAAGIIVTILLFFVSIYLAGIVFIILVAIVMSLIIMQDTAFLPQVDVELREDAKAIVLTNKGNSPATTIHVALVPMNIEYDVDTLAVDESHEYPLTSMVAEVKAVVTFSNEKGQVFSHSRNLSSSGEEFEPLKPMIPVFGWK